MSNIAEAVQRKIARLRSGHSPRVLDLFARCGGISLGFAAAGFTIAGAVEFDRDAASSHGKNFHDGHPAHSKARDITKITPQQLVSELNLGRKLKQLVADLSLDKAMLQDVLAKKL